MNNQNLKPLSSEKARDIGIKGGLVRSDNKKYAALLRASPRALCKSCKANCLFQKGNIIKAKNHRCTVPDARAKSIWFNQPVMCKEILDRLDSETLIKMVNICQNAQDLKLLHRAIVDSKKVDYPSSNLVSIGDNSNVTINFNEVYVEFKQIVFDAIKKELKPEQAKKLVEAIKEGINESTIEESDTPRP